VASWFCDYNQCDNLFNFWVDIIIIEFISIYLNDSKFKIQKYHLLLWLITTNIKTQFLMMMWHAMCQQGVPTNSHDINFNKVKSVG